MNQISIFSGQFRVGQGRVFQPQARTCVVWRPDEVHEVDSRFHCLDLWLAMTLSMASPNTLWDLGYIAAGLPFRVY